jgi:hypothetical protein
VADVGIEEGLYSRVGAHPGKGVPLYAKLLTQAWTEPSIDPFNPDYAFKNQVRGIVGVMGRQGFTVEQPECNIVLPLGCCKGVFFRGEVVRVFPWPFRDPSDWMPKYAVYGKGQTSAWTEKTGGYWRILPGRSTASGGTLEVHFIAENENPATIAAGPAFPGMPYPYSLDDGELDSGKPTKWKWLDAERKFCPLVQAPTDLITEE